MSNQIKLPITALNSESCELFGHVILESTAALNAMDLVYNCFILAPKLPVNNLGVQILGKILFSVACSHVITSETITEISENRIN